VHAQQSTAQLVAGALCQRQSVDEVRPVEHGTVVLGSSVKFNVAVQLNVTSHTSLTVRKCSVYRCKKFWHNNNNNNTHLTTLCPGLPRWAVPERYNQSKFYILQQETVSGSGIRRSASRSKQLTVPAPHHSRFLQAECNSCQPTNRVKALKETFPQKTETIPVNLWNKFWTLPVHTKKEHIFRLCKKAPVICL